MLVSDDHKIAAAKAAVATLTARYQGVDALDLLSGMIHRDFVGEIALVSSFGTESALLLSLVAEVDPATPVVFLDTGQMFAETLAYRDQLVRLLGLRDVRTIEPAEAALRSRDPDGGLWAFDPDACCALRKVEPLAAATRGFSALISGRKQYHGALRRFIPRIEAVDGVVKIDPLAAWSQERVAAEFLRRALPRHPLEAAGYRSVGCGPCTVPIADGAEIRSGRWAGRAKSECGIHLPVPATAA